MIRNLLFNCCPFSATEEWRRCVQELVQCWRVFNGRKLVVVKTGESMAPTAEVQSMFPPDAEFILCPNDARLQEVAGFVSSLALLESKRSDEATFYCHTKGVKYVDSPNLEAIRGWRLKMLEYCLGDIERVESLLQRHACAGCFRIPCRLPPVPPEAKWHYSGTFWWVRHDALFSRDWRTVCDSPYGTEAYLGSLFELNESVCIYDGPERRYAAATVRAVFHCQACQTTFERTLLAINLRHEVECPTCKHQAGRFEKLA